ncbi:MAG: hypothetical protein JSR59_18035 [Proteobacteria bacterium]|nr:hypothetical protein [Pseudomonadota bacterium]
MAVDTLTGLSASREREREALDRLSRVHGPGELHAALLALLLPLSPAASANEAWYTETEGVATATALRHEVVALGGPARLPCFEQLLERMAKHPLAVRQTLLESTRRLMRATGTLRPIDRLHWLVMRLRLGERAQFGARVPSGADLDQLGEIEVHAVARYSAYLSRMVPGTDDPDAGDDWYAGVMAPWQARGIVPERRYPDADALVQALQELQALPWMLRPALVRGWTSAALRHARHGRLLDSAADALYLTAALLDSPLPPDLARHYAPMLQSGPR